MSGIEMTVNCKYPYCNKQGKFGCLCHLGDAWWCNEHIGNHLEAMKRGKHD